MDNACLRCGACCAHYRVAFYWSEADPFAGGTVPGELTEALDRHRLAMRGTVWAPVRCTALAGEIGHATRCTIYPRRPSPCRELEPFGADGQPDAQCLKARAAHGLPPPEPAPGPGDAPLPASA